MMVDKDREEWEAAMGARKVCSPWGEDTREKKRSQREEP